jgi:hypothetical protein
LPFCLCPLNIYGTRCGLVYDNCWKNPCKNNGTCYPNTDDVTKVDCVCNEDYNGLYCESPKEAVDLSIHANNVSGAAVIQYFYIDYKTLDLILAHQDILKQLPDRDHYKYAKTFAPQIVLLKSFSVESTKYPKIFLLSLTISENNINSSITLTDNNSCLSVQDMFKSIQGEFSISI